MIFDIIIVLFLLSLELLFRLVGRRRNVLHYVAKTR
jgi:hypothetical protein